MDHVVYVDFKSKEMDKILNGSKTMIIRGAAGRKLPHGRVQAEDILYFMNNNGEGCIKGKAVVKNAFHSEKMKPEESEALVKSNEQKLQLAAKQYKHFAGKRYIVLIEIEQVKALPPFDIDRSAYGNMDDWLPVGDIETVKK